MTIEQAVLAILMKFPEYEPEDAEAKRARLSIAAGAIVAASDGDVVRVGRLIALGRVESGFARYVGEGRCEDGPKDARCDPDQSGRPTSRTYWQQKERTCPETWSHPEGSVDEIYAAARCADEKLRGGLNGCGTLAGAFGVYAGAGCNWLGGRPRARLSRLFASHVATLVAKD